jgi:hypothetical protein
MIYDIKEIAYWPDGTWCLKEDLYKFPLKTLETPSVFQVPASYKSDIIQAIAQDLAVNNKEINSEHQ